MGKYQKKKEMAISRQKTMNKKKTKKQTFCLWLANTAILSADFSWHPVDVLKFRLTYSCSIFQAELFAIFSLWLKIILLLLKWRLMNEWLIDFFLEKKQKKSQYIILLYDHSMNEWPYHWIKYRLLLYQSG